MGRSGTGLGMAVVWGTVRDHDGYIDVQSKIEEGSRFSIYFPVTMGACDSDKKESFGFESWLGKGELVLIVDDVADQREIATEVVEKLNYTVASVPSGEAAIEYLKDKSVDIMILDMIMDPGIDGLETYRRAIECQPGIKAVIASGYSESKRVREAQRLGAGEYLPKPYTMQSIAEVLNRELGRSPNKTADKKIVKNPMDGNYILTE
jgi:CheY-like chemotaxis protein